MMTTVATAKQAILIGPKITGLPTSYLETMKRLISEKVAEGSFNLVAVATSVRGPLDNYFFDVSANKVHQTVRFLGVGSFSLSELSGLALALPESQFNPEAVARTCKRRIGDSSSFTFEEQIGLLRSKITENSEMISSDLQFAKDYFREGQVVPYGDGKWIRPHTIEKAVETPILRAVDVQMFNSIPEAQMQVRNLQKDLPLSFRPAVYNP